ncbi:hypothetical protein F5B21DRAFT_145754 [Xylaria acuta]|nr:hypothetical protein F5B21DRAFT_145754 [Xylaria acuta]
MKLHSIHYSRPSANASPSFRGEWEWGPEITAHESLIFHRHVNEYSNNPISHAEDEGSYCRDHQPPLPGSVDAHVWHRTPSPARRRFDSPGRKSALPGRGESRNQGRGNGAKPRTPPEAPRLTFFFPFFPHIHHYTMYEDSDSHTPMHRERATASSTGVCVGRWVDGWVWNGRDVVFLHAPFPFDTSVQFYSAYRHAVANNNWLWSIVGIVMMMLLLLLLLYTSMPPPLLPALPMHCNLTPRNEVYAGG